MPPIDFHAPLRRLPQLACALTVSLAIGACGPASRGDAVTQIRSALTGVTPPIAVADDDRIDLYAFSASGGQSGFFNEGHSPHALALGDVNGDGIDEVIVGGQGFFRVFTQFGLPTSITNDPFFPFVAPTDAVVSGDVDGDGRDEIIVGSNELSGGEGEVLIFSTDPAFQPAQSYFGTTFPRFGGLAVCDLDGDGRDEVVVAPAFDIFHVAVVGNTTSSNKQFEAEKTLPDFFAAGKPTFKQGQDRIACADLNGDGFDDLIVAQAETDTQKSDYKIFTHPSRPPVTFFPPGGAPVFHGGQAVIAAGDLDGDGVAELVIDGTPAGIQQRTITVYSAPGKTPPAVFQGSTQKTFFHDEAFAIGRHGAAFAADQDGDSIPDSWETVGVDIDGDGCIDYDLPGHGANPLHKDLFIEVDFMACGAPQSDCPAGDTHTHRTDLSASGLGPVVEAFAQAPLSNPDGHSGVALHIEPDEDVSHESVIDLDRAKVFEDVLFGSAAERAQTTGFTAVGHQPCATTPALVLKAKAEVYRYALFGHLTPDAGVTGVTPGDGTTPEQRFILSLFESTTLPNSGPLEMQSTFMHELGHTLALDHGGGDRFNWKPNYLSVMNYRFDGIPLKAGGYKLDYSRTQLPDLFEINGPVVCLDPNIPSSCAIGDLFELAGIGSLDDTLDTAYLCPGGALTWVPALGGIDWNCNMTIPAGIHTYPNPAAVLPPDSDPEITVISDANGDRYCVDANPVTGVLTTTPNIPSGCAGFGGCLPEGDDFVMGGYIAAGPNGVLESAIKSAGLQQDDVVIAVPPPPPPILFGFHPPQAVIVAGPNKQINTAIPSGVDDAIVLWHVDPGSNGLINLAPSGDDVIYNDLASLTLAIRQGYGNDVLNALTRDLQPLFPLIAPGSNGIIDSARGDDVLVPVMIGPGPNGALESVTASNGLLGDDTVDSSGKNVIPGPDGFLQTVPAGDEIVQGLRIVDGPNRVCESSPAFGSGDVQSDEDGNGSTFRFPGSVQQGQLSGYDDWHHVKFRFRTDGTFFARLKREQTLQQLKAQLRQSALADVTVAAAPSAATIAADAPVTYHVTVTNHGPMPATSVRVAATLPDGMTLAGCQPGDGSACVGAAAIFPSIASGAVVTVDFTARTDCSQPAGQQVIAVFSATTESADPRPADDVVMISSTIAATKPSFTFVPPPLATSSCVGVALGTPVAADACSAIVSITNNAPAHFPLGRTVVTWRATAADGAQVTATQAVTATLADDDSCCPVGSHKIIGTSNNDVLTGTSGADCILGRGGQDHILGGGGDDAISGGDGDDFIDGQDGNDKLYGGSGQDVINGSAGNDLIYGGDGDDTCSGGIGDDTLFGGQGQDHLSGDAGNDRLFGEQGTDVLAGGDGNDDLEGGQAGTTGGTADQCTGGAGLNVFASCPNRPDAPGALDACHDGARDGSETGVDCGGAGCFPCAGGGGCQTGDDCQSGICAGGVCAPSKTPLWATIVVTADWGAGYCATIFASNLAPAPTVGWSVRIDTNQSTITQTWVGTFDGTSGSVLTTAPADQAAIASGATNGAIGFCANRLTSASTFPAVLNRGASF